jgi:hypothetical protein
MSDVIIEVEELLDSGLTASQIATKMGLTSAFVENVIEMIEQDI